MSKLTPIVETDELENVRAFCRAQLNVIGDVIDKISAHQASFPDPETERGQKLKASFESLQKCFNDAIIALEDDFPNFNRCLRTLSAHIQLKRSNQLFKYATGSKAQLAATKQANVSLIELMHQYIQNAEDGCAQRRKVFTFCEEQNIAILGQFDRANRDEIVATEIESPPRKIETEQRDRKSIPELKKNQPVRHLPVNRGRLFQDRKRVSALAFRPQRTTQSELLSRSRREAGGREDA
jgi:hypothetical protein